MESSEGWFLVIEFIIGAVLTQIIVLILAAVMGGLDASASSLTGQWKENYEGIESAIPVLFVFLDIIGGVGFVALINGFSIRGK